MLRRRPSPAFVLAFLALVVAMSGVGYAAIPARDGDVHLCYSKKTGAVEVVDTQKDDFDCEKNWEGFTFDTKPTKIASPSGKFSVEATDSGVRMVGPDATITLGAGTVDVQAGKGVDVRSNSVVDVVGGNDVTIKTSKVLKLEGAGGMALSTPKSVAVTGGDNVAITGGEDIGVTAGKKLDVTGGTDADLTAGRNVTIRSGGDMTLDSGKKGSFVTDDPLTLRSNDDTIFDVRKNLTVTVADVLAMTGKKVNVTSFTDMTLKTKNFLVNASGKADIKASKDLTLKGSKINQNR